MVGWGRAGLQQTVRATGPAARLDRLEEWIEAHLHEPITVGRMCEIACVGSRTGRDVRAMQFGFWIAGSRVAQVQFKVA